MQQLPEIANWTKERLARYESSYNRFFAALSRCGDLNGVWNEFPLYRSLFVTKVKSIHVRQMPCTNQKYICAYPCFAGSFRILCSSRGALYVCERTEHGSLFRIGHVETDVDTSRARVLTDLYHSVANCSNCVMRFCCTMCYAHLQESWEDNGGKPDALRFQRVCQKRVGGFSRALQEYTEVMESNSEALDLLLQSPPGGWISDISAVVTEQQLGAVEVGIEEVEEPA